MMDTIPSWTDERVDLLRRLWEDGLSASQIASQIGGISRNAVIGKVHRLGLAGRVKAAASGNGRGRKASSEPEVEAAVGNGIHEGPVLPEPPAIISHRPAPDFPEPAAPALVDGSPLAVSERVTIMDLRESMCRWPIGDPTSQDFRFCGARSITGLPYCTHHAQVAYQPAAERKRDRRVAGFR